MATRSFLRNEARFEKDENKVYISKIFYWYKGDFGGKSGTLKILKKYKKVPEDANPKIVYNDYNWDLLLDHYAPETEEPLDKNPEEPTSKNL